jgi:hypothetical protein
MREEEPDLVGLFVYGSYARGTAEPGSDLDIRAVTLAKPRVPYRTWFVGGVHVSIGARSADELRRAAAEPVHWALGFAVDATGVWLWSTAAAVAVVGDPPRRTHPPGEPELEDFVEAAGKALRARDSIALRLAARSAGALAPRLVRDLNASRAIASSLDAVHAALALEVVPDGWSDDLRVMLGLAAADDDGVRAAVERLARGLLALLRERAPDVDPQPEISRYLADGTLERHLGFEPS